MGKVLLIGGAVIAAPIALYVTWKVIKTLIELGVVIYSCVTSGSGQNGK